VKSWSTSSFELEAEALMERRDLALVLGVDANGEVDGTGRTPTMVAISLCDFSVE
jgi:hypothetical protein